MRGLYAVYDRSTLADDALESVAGVLSAGVGWLQYRDKRSNGPDPDLARRLLAQARAEGVGFIVNDDWRLALALRADGVHLGADDGNLRTARAALGPQAVIGASCQASLERARAARDAGADYLSFGRFFTSATKPDAPAANPAVLGAAHSLNRDVVAIGGITTDNAGTLIAAGTDAIAVSGTIFQARSPQAATQSLAALFGPERR